MENTMGTPSTSTSTFDRIAAAQKRSMLRDFVVAVTLVFGLAGGGLALESSARSLFAPKPMTPTVVATPELTEAALASVAPEGDTECFVAFGETC